MAAQKLVQADFKVVGSYKISKFLKFDAQRTINMYEVNDPEGKKPNALFPTYGSKRLISIPGNAVARETFQNDNFLYHVAGANVYRIDSANLITLIGILTT